MDDHTTDCSVEALALFMEAAYGPPPTVTNNTPYWLTVDTVLGVVRVAPGETTHLRSHIVSGEMVYTLRMQQ